MGIGIEHMLTAWLEEYHAERRGQMRDIIELHDWSGNFHQFNDDHS